MLLNVTVLALGFLVLLRWAPNKNFVGRLSNAIAFALPLFAVINLVRTVFFESALSQQGYFVAALVGSVPILFAVALFSWQNTLLPAVEFVILGLALLIPFNVIQAISAIKRHEPLPRLADTLHDTPRPRVVWLIFDEMDYTLTFPRRPPGIALPQLDRLRSQSLFATSVYQPGRNTVEAIPSLLTGRTVARVRPQGTNALLVQFSGAAEFSDLAHLPNALSDARSALINVGVVGWYFPYCRMFPPYLTECEWASMYSGVSDRPNVWTSFRSQFTSLTPLESRLRQIRRVPRLLARAEEMVSNPNLGFVMIHFPLPHGPEIFDRYTGKITPFALHRDWYYDNLLLADRMLGELRSSMEQAGMWERSIVIFSSDHSLREEMMPHPDPTPLVPFMVKCPGQHAGHTYDATMNAIVTRDLIKAFELGEVSEDSLPAWLRAHTQ